MKPIVLLNSLPEAYKEVKKCTYIWQRLSKTNAIVSALRTRELEIQLSQKEHQSSKKEHHSGDRLFVKGKSHANKWENNSKIYSNDENKAQQKKKCKYCKKK